MSKKRKQPEHLNTLADVMACVSGTHTMFIDSGSSGTGWAVFYVPMFNVSSGIKPSTTGVLISRARTWVERIAQIAEEILLICEHNGIDRVVIEWPELWAGSAKSHAAAASGKLLQLAAACGALIEGVHLSQREIRILLMTPREWKGQLTKPAVNARIKRAIGEVYPNHVSDAVGMGLAVMGLL